MRAARVVGVVLGVAFVACAGTAVADDASVVLEGPTAVHEVLREDFDQDGVKDLLVVEGRTLFVWKGRLGALPSATAIRIALAADVSAVDVAGKDLLLTYGRSGLGRLALGADGAAKAGDPWPVDLEPLAWVDHVRANFADFVRGDRLVLPTPQGWLMTGLDGGSRFLFEIEAHRAVTAPGPFLEDSSKVEDGLPEVVVGAPFVKGGVPSIWALSGDRLLGQAGSLRASYDVSFIPQTGERRLVDMDADGVPDVVHGDGTNREQRIAFFRTPPPEADASGALRPAGSLKPPLAFLQLTGYPLDPATVDLDGDGRRDFVLTSIEIDTPNVVSALTGGKVKARTRGFMNRRGPRASATDRLFPNEPDASITSDIGVRIRFGYTGNIDIQRSFTIVVDGDYDGDGRLDLAIREGFDAIRIRRGTPEGVWEAEGRRLAIPPMGEHPDLDAYAVDLTGDRKDELVLVYRAPPGGRDRLVVLRPGG